jgi:hypothetical protein
MNNKWNGWELGRGEPSPYIFLLGNVGAIPCGCSNEENLLSESEFTELNNLQNLDNILNLNMAVKGRMQYAPTYVTKKVYLLRYSDKS